MLNSTNPSSHPVRVRHWDHLNMTVRNLSQSVEFYRALLGFEVVERGAPDEDIPWLILRSGEAMLCLYEHGSVPTGPKYPERPVVQDVRHFALRIEDGAAFERLAAQLGVDFLYGGPVTWPHSTSYYLTDPTGHQIEVVNWHDDTVRFDPLEPAPGPAA